MAKTGQKGVQRTPKEKVYSSILVGGAKVQNKSPNRKVSDFYCCERKTPAMPGSSKKL